MVCPETASEVNVPTEVSDDAVTPEAKVPPVSVPAAAVTVIFAVPSNDVPLIVLAFCRAVAVPAFPVTPPDIALVTVRSVKNPAVNLAPVAPREPVEVMLFVPMARVPPRVSDVRVPTLVRLEAVTPVPRVDPLRTLVPLT